MGRDKALIEVDGRALAVVAADALAQAGAAEVFTVGGDQAALAALGLTSVADRWPGEGPLGGIVTALEAAASEVVVVLSCDLPRVAPDAVTAVVAALGDADAAMPTVEGRRQLLLGVWRRSACLPVLTRAFTGGQRAVWRAVGALAVAEVTLSVTEWAEDADEVQTLFRPPFAG